MFDIPKSKDIVFVDIEANDKPPRLLQFGAIKFFHDGRQPMEVNWFCNPKCEISHHVKKMVYKNIQKINQGETAKKTIKKISDFVKDTVFISYGNFDYKFLDKMYEKQYKSKLNCEFIDLQLEWQKTTLNKDNWSLKSLSDFFKIKTDDDKFHDAFYDAKILSEIYHNWKKSNKDELLFSLFKSKILNEKCVKKTQNKNKTIKSSTLNNLEHIKGYVVLSLKFKSLTISNDEKSQRFLTNLDLIEIQNNKIKRNLSFSFEINENNFDRFAYFEELVDKLKIFVISIRNKKIIINDKQYQDYIKLLNLCSLHINVFPLNKIIFSNGFDKFFDSINWDIYKYSQNINLIKLWLVFTYLDEKCNN